ncbi:FixH family protein [Paenibacillus sp. strain BS8-2]
MMKRTLWRASIVAMGLASSLLLGACTAQTGNLDEHGLRPHLNVDLQIPAKLKLHQETTFSIALAQGGNPATADSVTFEFWPEDNPEHKVFVDGVQDGEGVYIASYDLPDTGIYVVRCLVTSGTMKAMPAKRFAIGEEAVLHLAAMEKQGDSGDAGDGDNASGHQHH